VTCARSGKTVAKQGLTCASIARIAAKARHSRNFAQTGGKSDPTDARYLVTGVSCDRTVAIYVATAAIFGGTGATRGTEFKKRGRG
jgi:hypothetical protein